MEHTSEVIIVVAHQGNAKSLLDFTQTIKILRRMVSEREYMRQKSDGEIPPLIIPPPIAPLKPHPNACVCPHCYHTDVPHVQYTEKWKYKTKYGGFPLIFYWENTFPVHDGFRVTWHCRRCNQQLTKGDMAMPIYKRIIRRIRSEEVARIKRIEWERKAKITRAKHDEIERQLKIATVRFCHWTVRTLRNSCIRFVNYLKTGHPTLSS